MVHSQIDSTRDPATEPPGAARALVGAAVSQALDHCGPEATVNAILLALRHLRREVGAYGGYGAQRQCDDVLRRHLADLHIKQAQCTPEAAAAPHTLSAPVANRSAATVILEDAMESALMMHVVLPDSDLLDGAFGAMIGHLARLSDQVPRWDEVIDLLDEPEAVMTERALQERPAARIH